MGWELGVVGEVMSSFLKFLSKKGSLCLWRESFVVCHSVQGVCGTYSIVVFLFVCFSELAVRSGKNNEGGESSREIRGDEDICCLFMTDVSSFFRPIWPREGQRQVSWPGICGWWVVPLAPVRPVCDESCSFLQGSWSTGAVRWF